MLRVRTLLPLVRRFSKKTKDIPFSETRKSSDPDVFRGPGGYTARELFNLVGGKGAEGEAPAEAPAGGGAAARSVDPADLDTMTVPQLMEVLRGAGVDYTDCFDRESLLDKAKEHLGGRA